MTAVSSSSPGRIKPRWLAIAGWLGLALVLASVVDIVRPRPFDGVALDEEQAEEIIVREVLPDSGAASAGIRAGDRIVGIDRTILRSSTHAGSLLGARSVGDEVPYLIENAAGLNEVKVQLGPRRLVTAPYIYACVLGFAFFFVGWFVFRRQPRRRVAQLFFLLCVLFMWFLAFRLRPLSYGRTDALFLELGTLALVWLPACFFHFFLIFPRRALSESHRGQRNRRPWMTLLTTVYTIPALTLLVAILWRELRGSSLNLVSGAPLANWGVLAVYIVAGLGVLLWNAIRLTNVREKRGAYLVLFGSLFGLLPFLTTTVAFPAILRTERFLWLGVVPLALVPITFAYAIVVFRMLDVQVILRRSVLYTVTMALITGAYALGLVAIGLLSRTPALVSSPWVPPLLALAVVFLFEPLRRRVQTLVERFFYADRSQLEKAIGEIELAFEEKVDLQPVVHGLVDTLPQRLELEFSGLYLEGEEDLVRTAGPVQLPAKLPSIPGLEKTLVRQRGVVALDELGGHSHEHPELIEWIDELNEVGVKVVALLSTPRRRVGLMVLGDKITQLVFEEAELDLLRRLTAQAAIALETNMLLEERASQAEMERELAIAAGVQEDLLPTSISFGEEWMVAAHCSPAAKVGGDFFTELPGPAEGARALVYGDVAGKSISGALMMMAAHEALHSLALTERSPERLFELANERLYTLGKRRSFVALAYLTASGDQLRYLLAGQPEPLLLRQSGDLVELDPPEHRIPLGGLVNGSEYRAQEVAVNEGDLVLCYSDGLVEATNPRGEFFGLARVREIMRRQKGHPGQLVQELIEAVDVFVEGAEPYDDITVIALKRRGTSS